MWERTAFFAMTILNQKAGRLLYYNRPTWYFSILTLLESQAFSKKPDFWYW
jgi:hypothetical protein